MNPQNGQTYMECRLNKRDSLVLIARLSPEFTGKVVDRWQELEAMVAQPRTQAEMLLASAQALVDMERKQAHLETQQAALQATTAKIESRVEQLAESRVWDHCPHNCEPISKIRPRINKLYGLPEWVIDKVVRGLPCSPKPAGEVRNTHENALGGHFTVWYVSDVTLVFRRFVAECHMVTDHFAEHDFIDRRFQLDRGRVPPSQLLRQRPMERLDA